MDKKRKALWLRTLHQWHWISSALSLAGMLLFSVTGITLNHASQISSTPVVTTQEQALPDTLQTVLAGGPTEGETALPAELRDWLDEEWSIKAGARTAEWSAEDVYLSLPRPGGDAWLSISRADGLATYEQTDRGWIAWLNDLHKGRHTGEVWFWFIDVFAAACLVFCFTGLVLLYLHSRHRPFTWPVTGLGLLLPVLLAAFFIH